MNKKRIFWLGMHKILVQTELVRLRKLGYEVFNPPYLSPIQDQSADMNWNAAQPSTLPKDVFEKLAKYNFFYNHITDEIAEILNLYFDAVIVTISPQWLASILKSYRGRVVFRTYGQSYRLSDELRREGILFDISNRKNFFFIPHAQETLNDEHAWLKERAVIVPYCLPADIFEHADQWSGSDKGQSGEVAVSCPNIDNVFFRTHYEFLKKNFSQPHYKFFGVQLSEIADEKVVGTLPRDELIQRFKKTAGYLYTYTDARVCYLPPIEMMVLGGPVLFLKGSLLDSYFDVDAPGRCVDIEEAQKKVARLLERDQAFIDALLASQKNVAHRYHPDHVWPVFDAFFKRMFDMQIPAQGWLFKAPPSADQQVQRLYLFHHFPGQPVISDGIHYSAYDGIPRVMRQIVQALRCPQPLELWVTARYEQAEAFYGFFSSVAPQSLPVKILVIDDADVLETPMLSNTQLGWVMQIKQLVKKWVPPRYWPVLVRGLGLLRRVRTTLRETFKPSPTTQAVWYRHVDQINDDAACKCVIVPHYYWFPEALSLNKNIYLYLPDYMPHFFHGTGEFVGDEGVHTDIGRAIAAKAKVVFCNSEFTKEYLPKSRLCVDKEKIRVFYLPLLNVGSHADVNDNPLPNLLSDGYVFYPTQPRPNKNLSFLLRVFDSLVQRGHDLKLVLTCQIDPDPKALAAYRAMSCPDCVVFMPHVSDAVLGGLYRHAALLCFTSLAEGNFPPQIQEAIVYGTPVVATNLGFITERVPKRLSDALLLCKANDLESYVSACEFVIDNKKAVLDRQNRLREIFLSDGIQRFEKDVASVFFN